jgi:hypothetical protein
VRQKLDVSVGAPQRRRDERANTETAFLESAHDLAEHRLVYGRIAHDPAATDARSSGFELRLDQEHEITVGRRQREQARCDRAQRDERDVDDTDVDRRIDRTRLQRAHVGAFHDRDARIFPQRPCELTAAHVDRDHRCRAAL